MFGGYDDDELEYDDEEQPYESSESEPDASEDEAEQGERDMTKEVEVDGDFDRLIQSIRAADADSSTGMLSKDWDLSAEEQEAMFKDDLRAASGIGRKRGRKPGRRTGPALSQQVRAVLGDANQAYINNDIPETMRLMREVIRIEPRAAQAWSVLANCYADLGEKEKALRLRVMGAHLHWDKDEWESLARESREVGFNQQALYCYAKLATLDPDNVNALWDRAALAKETGDLRTAKNSLLALIKRLPHSLTVLAELRPILIDLGDLPLLAELYQAAFDHYTTATPGPPPADPAIDPALHPSTSTAAAAGTFTPLDVLVLADLHNALGAHAKAVHVVRAGTRWFQGRGAQRFWDALEDDREYDLPGEAAREGREAGGYVLDVNARHRLAVARIRMGDFEEGMMHATIVLSHDVAEYAPLFGEIADAYMDREHYAQARPIYELLGQDVTTSSVYVLLQVARCCHMLGDLKEAAEVYESVIAADPTNNDAKMRLAEIYEVLGEPRKALDLVYQVIDARKRRPRDKSVFPAEADVPTSSLFEEAPSAAPGPSAKARGKRKAASRLTAAQIQELEHAKEEEARRGYARVRELWPHVALDREEVGEAEREWVLEAEKLVEMFRETRMLFLTTRNNRFGGVFPAKRRGRKKTAEAEEEDMASRLQLDLEQSAHRKKDALPQQSGPITVFRTISFDDWLELFMQYAFLLTKRGQYDVADEVLRHILFSNAYLSRSNQDTIRLALTAIAIHEKQWPVVVEQYRKLTIAYQFNNEPLRLLAACLASGFRSTDAFIVSTLQKHLLREIRLSDAAVKSRDNVRWSGRRWAMASGGTSKEDANEEEEGPAEELEKRQVAMPDVPTKNNPILVTMYGQIALAAKSYQTAIFYLLHGYDYFKDDPLICLSLAIAYMGRAMQRQADNRHHFIAQAMAFLSQYREMRRDDPGGMDEVEFNFGRAFQQLGLHSLAVKHYERVLNMAETRTKTSPNNVGLSKEAAYNLSLIFVMTGATPLAETLYRRWLSL